MISLSWSRHVIAHELRAQGDYGGFLGTTEMGSCVVIGPRPGSVAAREGEGKKVGDAVLYMMGGLGVDGVATRYVRMFVPDFGGGSWQECAPLVHPRAYAAAAFLPAISAPSPHYSQTSPTPPPHTVRRPATTSSVRSSGGSGRGAGSFKCSPHSCRATLSNLPTTQHTVKGGEKGGGGDGGAQPSRLVMVGGVSDTQRFLKTAEVLDVTDGGVCLPPLPPLPD